MTTNKTVYNKDYYENGVELGISGYTNYRWMPELTIAMCHEMVMQLGIKKADTILDFGCAKGYLVRGFRCLHYNAWGLDVSRYAITQSDSDTRPYLLIAPEDSDSPISATALGDMFALTHHSADWIIAKDVLEHIPYDKLQPLLRDMRKHGKHLFAICPLGENGKYVVPEYENDVTHIIREPLDWWVDQFKQANFNVDLATYRMPHLKENWSHHEHGNGFFVLS